MRARRASFAVLASAVAALSLGAIPAHGDSEVTTTSQPKRSIPLLRISVPDQFSGCSILDSSLSDSMQGVLDLVSPSAFVSNRYGRPQGANGPIAQSELISVSPQVVQYRLNTKFVWSTGQPFSGAQMVQWWNYARQQTGAAAVNYQSINSMVVAPDGNSVTATFGLPNSDWAALFRDMQLVSSGAGCSLSRFLKSPQLGPYQLVSINAQHAVLVANPKFAAVTGNNPLAQRIDISAGNNSIMSTGTFAVISHRFSDEQLQRISSLSNASSFAVSSSSTERVTFSAVRTQEASANVRSALAAAIDRSRLVWRTVGLLNPGIAPAASSIYPQSSPSYPGQTGTPVGVTTTTSATPPQFQPSSGQLSDCSACSTAFLRAAGYVPTTAGWTGPSGPLIVRLAVGPTIEDRMSVTSLVTSWRAVGVRVLVEQFGTELAVLEALRSGYSDAGVYHLPQPLPAEYATRWALGPKAGALWTGWDSAALLADYQTGLGTLNSVTAASSWSAIDNTIQRNVWDRPLYSLPNFEYWSSRLPLQTAANVVGLFDEILSLTPSALSS